jgi:hypothetical protein
MPEVPGGDIAHATSDFLAKGPSSRMSPDRGSISQIGAERFELSTSWSQRRILRLSDLPDCHRVSRTILGSCIHDNSCGRLPSSTLRNTVIG